ncbi:tRNA lysidine(34) synthetase TilS [Mucilaginibacter pocheonensis]|uniref:tRNA(Ile)-lysidine synthase n=1 Tax=Mucilaginibacter pocheonensis TaxID=398050 RepID=A0ABU1TAE3_9SPHI|nr:tRNA lysidine(34) synthetase TilS [Mucilaginibacter pocheonensis]MDR6942369.1 tRNA(Ile)-lysidine synthase [Mucilaginibacter pocheonensis]
MLPLKQFVDFIEQNTLFTPQSKILAAVSGGMDSVLMTHLLKAAGYNFGIAHCNFQLRGTEALRDQEFCNNLANQLRVPFHTVNFDTLNYAADKKVSIQMAARELRYQWFDAVCQQSDYQVIALAHHQNDTIETILLNLTRGTGIAGMHGILPRNGRLVRPLLFLKRDEITTTIADNNLAYVEDSSNASAKYARNKIRLEVVPKLKELNPSLEKTFDNNLKHFRDLEVLLENQIAYLKEAIIVQGPDGTYLLLDEVKKLNPLHLLLFKLLQEYGFNETTVDDLISVLHKHSGRIFESAEFLLILDRDRLILKKRIDEGPEPVMIGETDHEVNFGGYNLNILHDDSPLIIRDNPMAVSIDSALLIFPLTLRAWQEGDHFFPLGMKGRKKISDFFIGQKIALHQKNEVPLLINGNGDVLWVGGYRPDERYKVSNNTKKVTIFELFKLR